MSNLSRYVRELIDAPLIPVTATVHGKKRHVGDVHLDTFYKYIDGSRHILRSPRRAIAFDLDSVDQIQDAGAVKITVYDTVGYTKFHTTVKILLDKGFPIHRYGQEKQLALALKYWDIETSQKPKPSSYNPPKRGR